MDYSDRCVENFHKMKLDALVVIGGDGTLAIAHEFHKRGIPIVGVPKTIDNDIAETTMTFGFDTAVAFATDAIDRLHTTAEAHHRVMVVEVMGRYAGWIALYAGHRRRRGRRPDSRDSVRSSRRSRPGILERERCGARFSIVVVAEGAHDWPASARSSTPERPIESSGWAASASRCASELERLTGKESRHVVLGHLQRGGSPSAYDRVLATRFGSFAVELMQRGEFGVMTALQSPDIVAVPLEQVVGRTRNVPVDGDVVRTARNLGICFGD